MTSTDPIRLVVVSAGVSEPSSTRMLADRVAGKALEVLRRGGSDATASVIELAPVAGDIARAVVSGHLDGPVQEAVDRIAAADGLVVSTPVYKAGVSGLFKSFVDVLDDDLVIATPVVLAATAGSERHAMVVDDQLRPLFAFLRALPVPTSLFAAPGDWASPAFTRRIDRAAAELAHLVDAGVRTTIADAGWDGYQHRFAGNATRAQQSVEDVDFDTDLMRLATGGTAPPAR
ncbi:CE1759 family FMN reductase [Pseudonocardia sp. MH-G8]|uniref:CE1759 family FMN reductase n=1 Tax=Pseudonocardia sp. MH-G8 TaxID=1854588 RepID=UPI000B9FD974|nr:CE1759 family FMN reductase [Pseudonocardia sp. MH-G8]OZM83159.1 NADH-dependent FMN reductase [Pseudonocardia sp. MH-G8]